MKINYIMVFDLGTRPASFRGWIVVGSLIVYFIDPAQAKIKMTLTVFELRIQEPK